METLWGRQATVTKQAVVQRINRKLRPDWKQNKDTRSLPPRGVRRLLRPGHLQ